MWNRIFHSETLYYDSGYQKCNQKEEENKKRREGTEIIENKNNVVLSR